MNKAHFTYFGRTEAENREVRFYRRPDGMYVCEVEGYPTLKVTHPSKERVRAAFDCWYQMSFKDWGASNIEWEDIQ